MAALLPSGEIATQDMGLPVLPDEANRLASRGVPQPQRVVPVQDAEDLAVGREGDGIDWIVVAWHLEQRLARGRLPGADDLLPRPTLASVLPSGAWT